MDLISTDKKFYTTIKLAQCKLTKKRQNKGEENYHWGSKSRGGCDFGKGKRIKSLSCQFGE